MTKFNERVKSLNPNAQIYPVSAKTGEGLETLANKVYNIIKVFKGENENG